MTWKSPANVVVVSVTGEDGPDGLTALFLAKGQANDYVSLMREGSSLNR